MKRKTKEKLRAIELREKGYSLKEILKEVKAAKSSISVWVRNIELSESSRERLLTKIKLGQLIGAENKRKITAAKIDGYRREALEELSSLKLNKVYKKIVCSLLYWCEGSKQSLSGARFTNSDPALMKTFLNLFRQSFEIDEKKLRVCVHLHEYHNKKKQLDFWAGITSIDKIQFMKPYLKPHTAQRIRKDYPGCATIYYHDISVARRMIATAKEFLRIEGV